mgnify:CR=1 FL=1
MVLCTNASAGSRASWASELILYELTDYPFLSTPQSLPYGDTTKALSKGGKVCPLGDIIVA